MEDCSVSDEISKICWFCKKGRHEECMKEMPVNAKSAENGLETALFKVRGLLEGNGSIPVYITLDAYQKLLAEKKKMNNVPVSTVLTAILEKFEQEPELKN